MEGPRFTRLVRPAVRAIALAGAIVMAVSSPGQADQVKGVRIGVHEAITRCVIDLADPSDYHISTPEDQNLVVVKFPDAGLKPSLRTQGNGSGLIRDYRLYANDTGESTLLMYLSAPSSINSARLVPPDDGRGFRLVIDLVKQGETPVKKDAATPAKQNRAAAMASVKKPSPEIALKLAAASGDPVAQFKLGKRYLDGDGLPADSGKAAEWFRAAAVQGFVLAEFKLGYMAGQGIGMDKDIQNAVRWFRRAANKGNVIAQFNLGQIYRLGNGIDKNLTETAAWYKEAADNGHAKAKFNLGLMYLHGHGVEKNTEKARQLIDEAARQGLPQASRLMGKMPPSVTVDARP